MKAWGGEVCTVEVDPSMIEAYKTAFRKYDEVQKIHLLEGSANAILNGPSGVQFDIIFIDAHKGEYIEYFETILQKGLLQPNGIILVDDTIHRGLVTDPSGNNTQFTGPEKPEHVILAQYVYRFNEHLCKDPRVDVVVLPVFNGLTLIKLRDVGNKR